MPLINFKTDLKSLSWGRDKRDGGSSKQPYITKDIPEGLSSDDLPVRSGPDFVVRGGLKSVSNTLDDVARLGKYMIDGASGIKFIAKENLLSRTSVKTQAGGLGYGGANQQQKLDGGSFSPSGGDSPSILQSIGNFVAGALGASGAGELVMGGGGGVNQGIYTPISTILSATGAAFGGHPNLLGLDPTANESGGLFPGAGITTYYGITKDQRNSEPVNQNRLDKLYDFHINNVDTSALPINVYSYSGGPGAILGIGNTNLLFADQGTGPRNPNYSGIENGTYLVNKIVDTTDSFIGNDYSVFGSDYATRKYSILNPGITPEQQSALFEIGGADAITIGVNGPTQNFSYKVNQIFVDNGFQEIKTNPKVLYDATDESGFGFNSLTYNQDQLITKTNVAKGPVPTLYPQDFRKDLYTYPNTGSAASQNEDGTGGNQSSKILSLSPDYRIKNKDLRLSMGQPGRSNTAAGDKNVWDYGINASELTALDKLNAQPMFTATSPAEVPDLATNDLVKFRIAAINNDANTPREAVYMIFRAHIDSFSDSYTSEWNPIKYVGRGDTLYNYQGFGRSISLGFTCYAQSKAELIPMYKKLNYLASTLAPDYSQAGFMRGNLVRLTIGGYLYEQPGFISGLTYTVPQESTWEIAINAEGGSDSSVKELPHMIQVSGFSFTPIHTFLPQKANDANNPDERYIALSNEVNSRGNYADEYQKQLSSGVGNTSSNVQGSN